MISLGKFFYAQNWNIGFSNTSFEDLLNNKQLTIEWLKHKYNDRFFADPFILSVSSERIEVLAEELIFTEHKGRIVQLSVDNKSKKLIERKIVLELVSHLSYPAILKKNGEIYIYPENVQGGKLNVYKYDEEKSKAIFERTLIDEPLADATLTLYNDVYWLLTTKHPSTHSKLYAYHSEKIFGPYSQMQTQPIIKDAGCARQAGNIIHLNNRLYRVGQDCTEKYGSGVVIQEITKLDKLGFDCKELFRIYPNSFKYNLGLHTLNFQDDLCVLDGYGYLYPLTGRVLRLLQKVKHKLEKRGE